MNILIARPNDKIFKAHSSQRQLAFIQNKIIEPNEAKFFQRDPLSQVTFNSHIVPCGPSSLHLKSHS